MASKGKKSPRDLAIEKLNAVSRGRPHPNVLWQVIVEAQDTLAAESTDVGNALQYLLASQSELLPDHTLVLTVSSALEQALEMAISTHFVLDEAGCQRMFDDNANGPLSTFAAKIKMAYALGIYPKAMRDDLDMIRCIRNAFAHSKERLDFTAHSVINGCAALIIPQSYPSPAIGNPRTAKAQFIHCAQVLYVFLEWSSPGPMTYQSHMFQELLSVLPGYPWPSRARDTAPAPSQDQNEQQ